MNGRTAELYFDLTLAVRSGMMRTGGLRHTVYCSAVFLVQFCGLITCLAQVVVKASEEQPEMVVLVEALHWVSVLSIELIWMGNMWLWRKQYLHMEEIIHRGFFTYSNGLDKEEAQLLIDGNDEAIRFGKVFRMMMICGCFSSMLRDPIFGGYISEAGSEVTRLKFYNTWIPFQVNTWLRYAGVCAFQFCLGLGVLTHTIVFSTMTVNCLIHLSQNCKLLQLKLLNVPKYAGSKAANGNSEEKLLSYLKECASHHQALIKFFDYFQKVTSLSFLVMYLNAGVIICAVGFIVVGADSNVRSAFAFLFVVAAELFFFAGNCYYGERIIQESSRLYETAFQTQWYEQPKKAVFYYQMFMIRSRKPLVVTGYGLKSMSLATFRDILQAAYSYFNMLSAAQN